MLLPANTLMPPFPFETTANRFTFGSHAFAEKSQSVPATTAHILLPFITGKAPERYSTPWPTYRSTWALSIFACPSMKIVPCTVSTRVGASHDSSPVGFPGGPTRHVYEDAGVRLKTVATLLLRTASLSKTGTVPLDVSQPCFGPGAAFAYQ